MSQVTQRKMSSGIENDRGGLRYREIYDASATERIRIIRNGVPATGVKRLLSDLHIDQKSFFAALNLKTATVNRKAARNESLSFEGGERVIGIVRLIGQLEAIIEESGNPEGFDAADWLSRWLHNAVPALGNQRPVDLLDTMEGQGLVAQVLAQTQSGAYA